MDLISRKAAIESIDEDIEAICEENDLTAGQKETASMCRKLFVNEIAKVPSVPAVPLDKLCEWLAKYIGFPCNYSPIDEEMADYCGDQCEMDDIGCWKKVLSKWMEGLDDHR